MTEPNGAAFAAWVEQKLNPQPGDAAPDEQHDEPETAQPETAAQQFAAYVEQQIADTNSSSILGTGEVPLEAMFPNINY